MRVDRPFEMSQTTNIPTAAPGSRGKSAFVRVLLVLTAIVGMFICGVLLRMTVAGSDRSVTDVWCKLTDGVDCSHVLASRWSKIGFVPTAQIGIIYFACAAVWFIIIGIPNRRGRAWHLLPIALAGCGLIGSGVFLFIMSRLPVWCTWCAAAHAANLAMFILAIVGWFVAAGEGEAKPTGARVGAVVGTSAMVGVILLLGGAAYRQQQAAVQFQRLYVDIVNDVDYVIWRHAEAERFDIPVGDDDMTFGRADAPHTLVVFSDFECDACAHLHRESNIFGLVASFPDSLRVVFKHYPVCRECNRHVDRDFHFYACDAATAAEAARRVAPRDTALAYWRLLYENRSRFDENPYAYLAKEAKIDVSRFEEARRNEASRQRVETDIELAHRLGVEGTPTLFLDGRRLSQWRIVEKDRPAAIDRDASMRLWRTLLGVSAASQPASDRP